MKNLRLGTWNINSSCLKLEKNNKTAHTILELIESERLDFLALQEVNGFLGRKIISEIENSNEDYHISESFSKIMDSFNKKNIIIAKNKEISHSICNYNISNQSSGLEIKKSKVDQVNLLKENIIFLNAIVYFNNEEEKEEKLRNLINNISYVRRINKSADIIISGYLDCRLYEEFEKELSKLGLKLVRKISNGIFNDYIIISRNYTAENIKIINRYKGITENRPVVACLKYKMN